MPDVFTNVVKPTHICNISCRYCYNEDTRAPIMTRETLVKVIEQTFAVPCSGPQRTRYDFIWHGGEPLVPGLSFYKDVIDLQHRHANGRRFENTMQTNGLLINDDWATFFKANRFNVSISIDGPKHLNDQTRIDLRGRGTFDRVSRSLEILRRCKVPFGVCVVITRANESFVDDIYDFLVAERLPFNVIPLTLSGSAKTSFDELGLDAEEYASPWITMFDRWFDSRSGDYIYCSDFAFKTKAILSGRPADCIGQVNCSRHHVSTDPDGYVYPCATLSGNAEWRYGNIHETALPDLLSSTVAQYALGREIDPQCATCKWQHVCHGGCMQRAFKFTGDHNRRDYYCPSLFRMYEHVENRLRNDGSLTIAPAPHSILSET
ncbi:dynobactin maturation radical SAM/SPASM protein DynA [Sphingomonas qilianensis]|uniref:Dynobactin maturation radical SAM/SPASM protein DynA n=1 Tax=Sphingomonas qilianensis TaxID=1736690 RepID=A0ABU9XVH3_9SPHN